MKACFLDFAFPGIANVHCVFTGRFEGAAPLAGNISFRAGQDRAKVLAAREHIVARLVPRGLENLAEAHQVHGDELLVEPAVTGLEPADLPEADGMMSRQKNLGLVIKTADCQPILVAHRAGGRIMAIHAGWRGNRANFPQRAVERVCATYKLEARDVFAVRGPSLGPANARFVNFEKEWPEEFRPWLDEQNRCMDLWNLTREQLQAAGIPARQIFGLDICTLANREQFFSYRDNKCPGRQASIIWIDGK